MCVWDRTHVAMVGALASALAEQHSDIFKVEEIEDVAALYTHILGHLAASDEKWKQTGVLVGFFSQSRGGYH